MTEGAVKGPLHRGRKRFQGDTDDDSDRTIPSPALVDQFLAALASQDMKTLQAICLSDLRVELVGGACLDSFEQSKTFFGHAHMVFPPEYAEIARIRCYCFAPDTLAEIAAELGLVALRKPYRSP